jgi:hypothetical protein
MQVAPVRDADGDGEGAPPCGGDCNDADRSVYSGASERCDLIDQDCDGRIDEMAPPTLRLSGLPTEDPTMTIVGWGDRALVTDAVFSRRGVRVRPVLADGTLGTTSPLHDTTLRLLRARAAPTREGALFVLHLIDPRTDAEELAIVRAERGPGGGVRLSEAAIRRPVESASDVALVIVGAAAVVAWDEPTQRMLWSPTWRDPVAVTSDIVSGFGPLDLATDGTHVVVPVGQRRLAFYSPEDGALTGHLELDAELAPGSPLASEEGSVIAIVRDPLDRLMSLLIRRVRTSGSDPPVPLPDGRTLGVRVVGVEPVSGALLFFRTGIGGTEAWLLDRSDFSVRRFFTPGDLGAASASLGTEVAVAEDAVFVLTNYGHEGASLALLGCGL